MLSVVDHEALSRWKDGTRRGHHQRGKVVTETGRENLLLPNRPISIRNPSEGAADQTDKPRGANGVDKTSTNRSKGKSV